jgi:hypothetical protein
MFIEDGKGSGQKAEVQANKLGVNAHTITELESINEEDGQVFSIPLDAVAPSGATFFWVLQNNGQSTYAFVRLLMASSAAGVFRLSKVSGTPAGGTNVVASSLNLGFVTTVDNLLLQTGASITGLTETNAISLIYFQANVAQLIEFPSRIYLPPGAEIAFKAPGAATVNGSLLIYREAPE